MKIDEGILEIPAVWHDATVNVYTENPLGERGLSVTINRDRLPSGKTLEEYVDEQTHRLAEQLKDFLVLSRENLAVPKGTAYLLEFRWRSKDVGEVHQLLMSVSDGPKVLNFAGSCVGSMDEAQNTRLRSILLSFQPA